MDGSGDRRADHYSAAIRAPDSAARSVTWRRPRRGADNDGPVVGPPGNLRSKVLDQNVLVGWCRAGSSAEIGPRGVRDAVATECDLAVVADERTVRELDEGIRTLRREPRLRGETVRAGFRGVVDADRRRAGRRCDHSR